MNDKNTSLVYVLIALIVIIILCFIGVMSLSSQKDAISSNFNAFLNTNVNVSNANEGIPLPMNENSPLLPQNENTNVSGQNENLNSSSSGDMNSYENAGAHISLQYPKGIVPQANFAGTYLVPDTWSALDPDSTAGDKLVAFSIPKSNEITSAGIRIATSKNEQDRANCTIAPSYATFEKKTKVLNGNMYTVLSLSDAAMNHYSTINSYRLVKNDLCYVIDTYVTGTNPEVYDPQPTPPFTKDTAFDEIDKIVSTLQIK